MLRTLQSGRALAAIGVAAFHLSILMGEPRYGGAEIFREYTRHLNHGVDFFFVLSGFIILFAHSRDIGVHEAWPNYVFRRFVRLYPIYWLYTLVFVSLLGVVGGEGSATPTSAADWITSLTLIRFTSAAPPIPVAWTLFHEVAFYAVFSVLLLSRRLGIAAFVIFASLPFLHALLPRDANAAFTVYTARFNWYFMLGMAAFWLYEREGRGFAELAAGIFSLLSSIAERPFPDDFSPLLLVAGFALMLAGVTKLERSGWITAPYLLAYAGDASYTIYLLHSNLEGTLMKAAIKFRLMHLIGSGATFFVILAGTILLGCIAYRFVERPLLDMLRRRRRDSAEAGRRDDRIQQTERPQ